MKILAIRLKNLTSIEGTCTGCSLLEEGRETI